MEGGCYPMSQPPTFDEIRDNLLKTVNEAVHDVRYMEIITAISDNIDAKINPEYENLGYAITAKSGTILATNSNVEGEDATRKKADDELKGDILARTWIGLDGDIAMILPKNRGEIDPEILQLHKANVDVAVQNWRYFIDTMLEGLKILSTLTQK
jgi:hypothetical protein